MRHNYQEKAKPFFPLFARPNSFVQSSMVAIGEVIEEVLNQSPSQRHELKYAIRDLSALLTNERADMAKPYWTSSRFIAAYTSFFLPWNLIRLTQLYPYLELPEVEDGDYVVDIGSGTLTAIIALWIARPDYREKKLNIIATDVANKPMEIGKEIFVRLIDKLDISLNWNIRLEKKHSLQVAKGTGLNFERAPKLLISANVLNELETRQGLQKKELNNFFYDYTQEVKNFIAEDGAYLAIEPGTRQGGRIITSLRENAIENQLFPYAPCPHPFDCPIQKNRKLNTWCHLQCPTYSPSWLKEISKEAKMERDNLNLSFVLLKKQYEGGYPNVGRVISNAFSVPGRGRCRYICTDRGLALLTDSAQLPHSVLVSVQVTPKRDQKSNAYIAYIDDGGAY